MAQLKEELQYLFQYSVNEKDIYCISKFYRLENKNQSIIYYSTEYDRKSKKNSQSNYVQFLRNSSNLQGYLC